MKKYLTIVAIIFINFICQGQVNKKLVSFSPKGIALIGYIDNNPVFKDYESYKVVMYKEKEFYIIKNYVQSKKPIFINEKYFVSYQKNEDSYWLIIDYKGNEIKYPFSNRPMRVLMLEDNQLYVSDSKGLLFLVSLGSNAVESIGEGFILGKYKDDFILGMQTKGHAPDIIIYKTPELNNENSFVQIVEKTLLESVYFSESTGEIYYCVYRGNCQHYVTSLKDGKTNKLQFRYYDESCYPYNIDENKVGFYNPNTVEFFPPSSYED